MRLLFFLRVYLTHMHRTIDSIKDLKMQFHIKNDFSMHEPDDQISCTLSERDFITNLLSSLTTI